MAQKGKGSHSNEDCCSFCGAKRSDVALMFQGMGGVNICNNCVERGYQMLVESEMVDGARKKKGAGKFTMEELMKPAQIKAVLDQYVIGQDDAKRYMSVAVYNHYKRILSRQKHQADDAVEIDKSNIVLVGATGTGKTLMARTIARVLNVPFTIVDATVLTEAGYVGEDVESILSRLLQVADYNVEAAERGIVFIDEIDKIAQMTHQGDPASALLEVLDPEQNNSFRDNYLEVPLDLSKVLFITTANDPSTIPGPLYDRMEVIELTSYTPEEKFMIAKNHLCKKQVKMHGLNGRNIRFTDSAIKLLIDSYTSEAGVRRLEQVIAAVCRKAVVKINDESAKRITVTDELVKEFLGPEKYRKDKILSKSLVGVVNGLAWTSVGGDMLQVEAVKMDGDGKIELTGSLGDVMKESAIAAYSYIKSNAVAFSIDTDVFTKKNIHIHVPQGAVPKDGPSAGVTIATAILSCLTDQKVERTVAMTGEITLTGRVLAIGGLKEKSMAAYKAGVKRVIIPSENLSDLWEIDSVVKNNIEFVPADNLKEVFDVAIRKNTGEQSSIKISPHDIGTTIISDRRKKDEVR